MKKLNFTKHIAPHLLAIVTFLIVTVLFYNPVFLDNKVISQQDIRQGQGAAHALVVYRDATGEEGLWAPNMFSGMPGYLVNVEWGYAPLIILKQVLSLGLPHPVCNTFLAFLCYYIMLLTFGVRPYLAIGGAIAFGLCSYLIVGVAAGHNARVGAIAFMPLVIAGVHLVFKNRRILGLGVLAGGLALHLRENHLQMTYYLLIMLVAYAIVQAIYFIRSKQTLAFVKNILLLVPAAALAVGTFFGPLWAIEEYSAFTIRGRSEISAGAEKAASGLTREYAFQYSNGILEPLTLMIPNFYGGSSSDFLVMDRESETYQALVQAGNQQTANQLARYSSAYWGPQRLSAPYYAGAIVCFLFITGFAFAEKKYVWWLVPVSALAIAMSWGNHFPAFNYFLFDYLPVYNKFRSVTFALIIVLLAMPLLGMMGLEHIMQQRLTKPEKKKILIVFGILGGLCFLFVLFAGLRNYLTGDEAALPAWFTGALEEDRKALFRADAFRSLAFLSAAFLIIYLETYRRFSPIAFYFIFGFLTMIDVAAVDRRYFNQQNFDRKRGQLVFAPTEADRAILRDTSYYRVFNINDPFNEARTSYFHNSIGGYHGAKIRRYQDLYDSCLVDETNRFVQDARQGSMDFRRYGVMDMLNIRYIVYGEEAGDIIHNIHACGPAWFVQDAKAVNGPLEELKTTCGIDPRTTAVVDASKFTLPAIDYDSTSSIRLTVHQPNRMTYLSHSSTQGLAVFSEIYYPKGWEATIDGQPAAILRANYVLRAMVIPSGEHTIEFRFVPKAYTIGNKITSASTWLLLLVVFGALAWTIRQKMRASGAE